MRFIGLLRGINVTGHNKIPMARLRQLCAGIGWANVQSYIQSGNLVFQSEAEAGTLEEGLEAAILAEFGFEIPVVVRTAQAWEDYMKHNPFPTVATGEPSRLLLTLSKGPLKTGAVDALNARADKGERVARFGDALYIHYPEGVGRSKLTPALLDRLAGSPVTARNWRTVLKLAQMLEAG